MKHRKIFAVFALLLLVLGMAIVPTFAQDEEAEPPYGIPEGYEVSENPTGSVTLTSGDDTIIINTATDYAGVISTQEFESDTDELVFFLERSGYSTGQYSGTLPDGAVAASGASIGRRSQQGVAFLFDLGRDRFAVISLHTGRGQVGAPIADIQTVASGFTFLGTIVDIAMENAAGGDEDRAGLSLLVKAVQNADASVLENLSGEGNFTVFAPTNQAFINLTTYLNSEYGITDLFADENQTLLTQVLMYHVVEGDVFAADVAATNSGGLLTSMLDVAQDGIVVSFDADGNPRLNGAVDFVTTDILASNGVVHVIDDVLLPQCVIDTLEETGSCGASGE